MPNELRHGRVIRDPVHGYVEVPDEIDPLLRSRAIQRLRHISQNSRAVAAFPSMTGTRYEHALGTMHLAIKAWGYCWRNTIPPAGAESVHTQNDFKTMMIGDARAATVRADAITAHWVGMTGSPADTTPLWGDFERMIGLVLGAIGLLHDVGHPPFSHVLEPFYASEMADIFGPESEASFDEYASGTAGPVQFHEWAGLQIFDSLPDSAFAALPRALIRRILADRSGFGWAHCLHSLIDGQFDVDRLDYLLRDATNAGTEFGAIDSSRLLHSLELHRPGPDVWRIGLGARAVSSFETLLIQRAQHYRWVVHHPASVAADTALKRCTQGVYELSSTDSTEEATIEPLRLLRSNLPALDYISGASDPAGPLVEDRSGDDHQMFAWLRSARPALTSLVGSASNAELRRRARTALALQDVFDTFAISPIPAWRNYQEFLARAGQNPGSVARIVEAAGPPETPRYLRTAASREAVAALLADLPARLNSALDGLIRRNGGDLDLRRVEELLALQAGEIIGCGGSGTWIVTHVPFFALQEDVANIWRGDEEALLSDVSPYPLALAAIEIMRPTYYVFFVPFEGAAREASTAQRREVGRVFFQTVAGMVVGRRPASTADAALPLG